MHARNFHAGVPLARSRCTAVYRGVPRCTAVAPLAPGSGRRQFSSTPDLGAPVFLRRLVAITITATTLPAAAQSTAAADPLAREIETRLEQVMPKVVA